MGSEPRDWARTERRCVAGGAIWIVGYLPDGLRTTVKTVPRAIEARWKVGTVGREDGSDGPENSSREFLKDWKQRSSKSIAGYASLTPEKKIEF